MEVIEISLLKVRKYLLNLKRTEILLTFRRIVNRMSGK